MDPNHQFLEEIFQNWKIPSILILWQVATIFSFSCLRVFVPCVGKKWLQWILSLLSAPPFRTWQWLSSPRSPPVIFLALLLTCIIWICVSFLVFNRCRMSNISQLQVNCFLFVFLFNLLKGFYQSLHLYHVICLIIFFLYFFANFFNFILLLFIFNFSKKQDGQSLRTCYLLIGL